MVQDHMVAARQHLHEGVHIALETGYTPGLLAGLLGMAEFWLRTGRPELGLACFDFVTHYPDNTPALQERMQQLQREQALTATSSSPGDPAVLLAEENLESFVQARVEMLV